MATETSNHRTLADRWELFERIGSGAMGEVWKGRHLVLGHEVAVKLMKRDASRDQSLVARFVREARIAAQLRHRNLARVEDFGTTPEGRPFLVMELLRGDSLETLLERHGRLAPSTVALVARHVGAACDLAHPGGIVHRDLKPANCFLVRDDDGAPLVKVLDFGVAKVADGLVQTAHGLDPGAGFALIGTPVYMSPEQVRGSADLDGRSDLWSLAVMLYELLVGTIPYDADALPKLLCAISDGSVVPFTSRDPALPAALDGWLRKALARDRSERFQTGRELADALVQALGPLAEAPPLRDSRGPLPATVPEFAAITLHPSAQNPSLPPVPVSPTAELSVAPVPAPMPTAPMAMMLLGSHAPPAPSTMAPGPAPYHPSMVHAQGLQGTLTPVAVPQRPFASSGALVAVGIVAAVVIALAALSLHRDDAPTATPAPTPPVTAVVPPRPAVPARPAARPVAPAAPVVAPSAAAPTRSIPTAPVVRPVTAPAVRPIPAVPSQPPRGQRPAAEPMHFPSQHSAPTHQPAPMPPPPSHSGAYNPDEP